MAVLVGGCSSAPEPVVTNAPAVLLVPSSRYDAAFDAAIKSSRDVGMTTAVRDRRDGVIETQPRQASTVFEPWVGDNSSLSTAMGSTAHLQRRRVRIEFAPVPTVPESEPIPPRLTGPDVLGLSSARSADLEHYSGELEMKVWVYLERAHTRGVKRFPWSTSLTSRWSDARQPIDPKEGVASTSVWTPLARDPELEQRIVASVSEALAPASSQGTEAPPLDASMP